jgi:hypothetical protein
MQIKRSRHEPTRFLHSGFINGLWYYAYGIFWMVLLGTSMNTAIELTEEHDAELYSDQYEYGWKIAQRNHKRTGVTKNYFPVDSGEFDGYRAYRVHIGVEQE